MSCSGQRRNPTASMPTGSGFAENLPRCRWIPPAVPSLIASHVCRSTAISPGCGGRFFLSLASGGVGRLDGIFGSDMSADSGRDTCFLWASLREVWRNGRHWFYFPVRYPSAELRAPVLSIDGLALHVHTHRRAKKATVVVLSCFVSVWKKEINGVNHVFYSSIED